MGKLQFISKLIRLADMFSSIELLRLNRNSKISTIEGGLVSIAVIITLTVSLASYTLETFQKTNITYTQTISNSGVLSSSNINMGTDGNFMFGIRLTNVAGGIINLNSNKRYMDFFLTSNTLNNSVTVKSQPIPLQQCTLKHWESFPGISKDFDQLKMSQWLCPQLNSVSILSGSFISQVQQTIAIKAMPCKNSSNVNNSVCYTQAQIDGILNAYGNLVINIFFTNPTFNLQSVEYVNYGLSSKGMAIISSTSGSYLSMSLSEFQINTDTSVMPFATMESKTGLVMEECLYRAFKYAPITGYMQAFFSRTPIKYTYFRQVQKIGSVFSYIGGLFGMFYSMLTFMNMFTEDFYKISMIKKIFMVNQNQQALQFCDKFNFFKWVYMKSYNLLRKVLKEKEWMTKLSQLQDEIEMQLDVTLLIKRITKLETIFIKIATKQQLTDCLKVQRQLDMKSYRTLRMKLGNTPREVKQDNELDKNQESLSQKIGQNMSSELKQIVQLQQKNINYLIDYRQMQDQVSKQQLKGSFIKEKNKNRKIRFERNSQVKQALNLIQASRSNQITANEGFQIVVRNADKKQEKQVRELPCTFIDP